jgi:Cdc6-like AAA superfamily ATPase
MMEVIQIPNQNGIIQGPGGVGKTALLIELSKQLSDEPSSDAELFKNIIWVSAKADYYDPTLDTVEAGEPQFRTLDNVLGAALEFFEWEDATKRRNG